MTGQLQLLYPLIFSALPVLMLASKSQGVFAVGEVVETTTAVVVPCAVIYGLLAVSLPRRVSTDAIAAVVFVLVLWFFGYADLYRRAGRLSPSIPWHAILLPTGIVATVSALGWLSRRPRVRSRLTVFVALTGCLVMAWSVAGIAVNAVRGLRAARTSTLMHRLLGWQPPAPQGGVLLRGPPRDIFCILLDEHANPATIREVTGFDNRPFEDSLRQLGFTIPRTLHNNYVHTTLSLPSLLNFSHLTALTHELGPRRKDPAVVDRLLQRNRAARFLHARGYEVVFLPSQWWPATRHLAIADRQVDVWPRETLREWASRGLARTVQPHTLLAVGRPGHPEDADFVRRTIALLKTMPSGSTPRFVVAHIISPHEPYALDRNCRNNDAAPTSLRAGYAEQVQCIDRLVLDLVRSLLARSRVPPVILLQGDHGTGFLGFAKEPSAASVSAAQARERFGVFGAYYLPDGGGAEFATAVTLVNVFPKVFNYYFAAGLPMSSDDLFMSVDQAPFDFRRVDAALLGSPPR